ncbi:unnamed protein product [Porites evermanni]|uniref:Uncharacterized protein n=1 Tax=Porites evermanni TaxID=104178 RepID=A0ABN8QFT1_9CNID|nr:unnamed protein product [Porites evermanni]
MSPSLIWENDADCSTASTIQPPPIIVSGAALTRIPACNPRDGRNSSLTYASDRVTDVISVMSRQSLVQRVMSAVCLS